MENENQNLIAALRYYDMGFSVIPVGRDKKPLVSWQQYQTIRAAKEQLEHWFKSSDVNVGVVTGAISGIVVVDVEAGGEVKDLPPTVISKTGGGGWHFFYKHPNQPVQNGVRVRELTDIRGDGGYVVMPPSLHQSGNRYAWSVSPNESDLADLPQWVFEEKNKIQKTTEGMVLEGTRNDTAAQVAGKLLGALHQDLWRFAWGAVKEWNQTICKPPLSEQELRNTFDSIARSENKKRTSEAKGYEIKTISLSELVGAEFPSPQWLVEKLIPHEALTLISGAPSSYKTFLTFDIALKVASGEKVFGEFQATQSPVLIIDEENHPRVLQERAKLLSQNPGLPIFIASKGGFLLGEGSVKKVIEYAQSKSVRLVIFDSFICIHQSDENVASEMRNEMKHLKEITNHGIAVIVIHHHRKKGKDKSNASQDIRGSSDILAQVDCHLAVDRKHSGDATVTIQQSKLRQAEEMKPFAVCLHSDGDRASFDFVGAIKEGQSKRGEIKIAVNKVLEAIDKPPNRKELWALVKQTGVKGTEETFKNGIKDMLDAHELFSKKGTGNSTLFSLKEFGADDG